VSARVTRSRLCIVILAFVAACFVKDVCFLMLQIHAEVREFWGVLETVAAARHNELLAALNAHLARLSQQVGREGFTLSQSSPCSSASHAQRQPLLFICAR
jgi:hypothetical protein